MNSLTHASAPRAPVLAQHFSRETAYRIDRIVDPASYARIELAPPSDEVRSEAERVLATIGPLETIGLVEFTYWIKPFFSAAGTRAVSDKDQSKQISALWDLIADMPAEVFTPENRRAVAKLCEFVPTAAKIQQVMGEQAERVIATRRALARLAEPVPPALPSPPALTPEQHAAEVAAVNETLRAYQAEKEAAATRRAAVRFREVHLNPAQLAAWRAQNPIVQAARAKGAPGAS